MNRHKVLLVLLMVCLVGTMAQAQDAPQAPPPQRGGGAASPAAAVPTPEIQFKIRQQSNPVTGLPVLELIPVLGGLALQTQQPTGQPANPAAAPRGAGGRGARSGGPPANTNNPDLVGEIRLILPPVDGAPNPVNTTLSNSRGLLVSSASGAWWTNTALLTRLGLTDDQKLKIERVFESNRQNLTASKDTLEKEEAQLAKLLDAEPLDRGSVTTQIYKVVQARGEMEKVNALMTLEMREVLTRAQWTQLQVQQSVNVSVGGPGGFGAGQRGAGGRGPGGFGAGTPGGGVAPPGTGGQRSGRGQ